jgi:hypothetical protein
MGQTRTWAAGGPMSGFTPLADPIQPVQSVRKVPEVRLWSATKLLFKKLGDSLHRLGFATPPYVAPSAGPVPRVCR